MRLLELGVSTLTGQRAEVHSCIGSEDGRLLIQLTSGLHVLRPSGGYPSGPHPRYRASLLATPHEWPGRRAGLDTRNEQQLRLRELTHVMMKPTQARVELGHAPDVRPAVPLTASLLQVRTRQLRDVTVHPANAAWSPRGLAPGRTSFLAFLTAAGDISVWEQGHDWIQRFSISKLVHEHAEIDDSFSNSDTNAFLYPEWLLKNTDKLVTTAICWNDHLYESKLTVHSHLITVQKNGQIHIWTVTNEKTWHAVPSIKLEQTLSNELKNVTAVKWINLNSTDSFILLGNTSGQIDCIQIVINDDGTIFMANKKALWPDADRVPIDKFYYVPWCDDMMCIVAIKQSHFIAFTCNGKGEIVGTAMENLGHIRITGVHQINDREFITTSVKGSISKLTLCPDPADVAIITVEFMKCNINFEEWAPSGVYVSKNSAIYILCCNSILKAARHSSVKLFYCYDSSKNFTDDLFNNEYKSLTDYWDCFEILIILMEKAIINCPKLENEALQNLSPYEAKVQMWLSVAREREDPKKTVTTKLTHIIMYHHAKKSLENYILGADVNELSEFEMESIALYIEYLEYFKIEYGDYWTDDSNVSELTAAAITLFGERLLPTKNACEWCEEKIHLINCSKVHPRQWCCVTLRNIESAECLVCPLCRSVAHPDLSMNAPVCTFCDSYMEKHYFTKSKCRRD